MTPRRWITAAVIVTLLGAFWLIPRSHQTRTSPTRTGLDSVTWHNLAGLQLPVSSTAGPHCLTATRAACFAHTQQGAAFAAAHLLARTFAFTGPAVFTPAITDQVTGPDQPAMLRQTIALYARTPNIGTSGTSLAGYRPATSTEIHVLIRQDATGDPDAGTQTTFTDFTVNLTWQHNDWHLIAPPWGDWQNAAHAVTSPTPSDWTTYDTTPVRGA